jgi:hypothetical protein
VAAAECFTDGSLAQAFDQVQEFGSAVTIAPATTGDELAHYLNLKLLTSEADLTGWCREAAERLMEKMTADIGLIIYNNITPGGVQLLVTLISSFGVSVMQRSFGGHPDNIAQWASALGMVHLRRWFLAHHPQAQ